MGVKHLWSIIDEAKTKQQLDCMRGKVVSVDLSIWIVEAIKTLQFKTSIKKPHLRNIFYRILNLRRLGVKLVFVTEGEAPDLKQETMKRRNIEHYGVKSNTKKKVGRSRFQRTIQECCKMLDLLGVPHVQAKGEAEAMCAEMSASSLTDGCLTNDGDFFLYGGQLIYRDFGIDPKDPHVFVYSMKDVKKLCGLTRDDLIGIGLLSGCDYCEGVPGVGKITLDKFIEESKDFDESILLRIKMWSKKDSLPTDVGKNEATIIKKSLKIGNLYNEDIVKEYTVSKDDLSGLRKKLKWKYPDVKGIQDFLLEKLEWPEDYTLSKVLQLSTSTYLEKLLDSSSIPVPISPKRIIKTRCQQGVALIEIEWSKEESDIYTRKWTAVPSEFSTLENQHVVTKVIPNIVEEFLESKKKKKTSKAKRTVKKKDENTTGTNIEEKNINENTKVNDNGIFKDDVEICTNLLVCQNLADSQDMVENGDSADNQGLAESEDLYCEEGKGFLSLSERIRLKSLHDSKENLISLDPQFLGFEARALDDITNLEEYKNKQDSMPYEFQLKRSDVKYTDKFQTPERPSHDNNHQSALEDTANNFSLQLGDSLLCDSFDSLMITDSPCVVDVKKSYESKLRAKFLPESPLVKGNDPSERSTKVVHPNLRNGLKTENEQASPLSLKERLKVLRQ